MMTRSVAEPRGSGDCLNFSRPSQKPNHFSIMWSLKSSKGMANVLVATQLAFPSSVLLLNCRMLYFGSSRFLVGKICSAGDEFLGFCQAKAVFFSLEILLRFTPPCGYHSRVSQEVSCNVELTGSSSLFGRSQAVPGIDFTKLRTMVSIGDVLALLDFVPAKSVGKQLGGPCPLHGSENPKSLSFSVNLGKHTFQCFTCKKAGNHLDLWAGAIRKPLFEAAVELCQRLHHDIPWKETGTEKRNP